MSSDDMDHKSDQSSGADWDKEESMKRLSKRLAYLLRYGAVKEGLDVDDNGYVNFEELCKVPLLRSHSKTEVLDAIKSSMSSRQTKRYDYRERNEQTYVRAAYLRNFDRSPYHIHTKVKTLFESSMSCILDNLDDYDLQDFPDEHILRIMIRRLKREKKLTNKALRVLLAPTVTRLDLEGVYLTNNTLRMVWTQCPHLQAVSLKDCGYIITDNVLANFTRNLPHLEKLNLCLCTHLTNRALAILAKNLPCLHTLHMSLPGLTHKGILDFLKKSSAIKFLDVYYLRTTPEEHKSLVDLAKAKEMTLVLRGPRKPGEVYREEEEVEEEKEDIDSTEYSEPPSNSDTENDDNDNEESSSDDP